MGGETAKKEKDEVGKGERVSYHLEYVHVCSFSLIITNVRYTLGHGDMVGGGRGGGTRTLSAYKGWRFLMEVGSSSY